MAQTATKRATKAERQRPQRAGRQAARKRPQGTTPPVASKARSSSGKVTGKPAKAASGGISSLARKAALKALKLAVRKAAEAGAERLREATERSVPLLSRATALGREAIESGIPRPLPVQVSVDVAVPLPVAWEEWMTFDFFTEGIHRLAEIERDGEQLVGKTSGPATADWRAEIVDEREQEAFAWRSFEGSDCAGLVTFHRLSERLTRIEVDLDLVPTSPAEAVSLGLHLARRRTESELRRFKAHVEFINPDVYADDLNVNGSGPDTESDQ